MVNEGSIPFRAKYRVVGNGGIFNADSDADCDGDSGRNQKGEK